MEAIKENNNENIVFTELMLLCAEINQENNTARFGVKTAEEILIQMCKEDPNSWQIVKKVVSEALEKIEAAAEKE